MLSILIAQAAAAEAQRPSRRRAVMHPIVDEWVLEITTNQGFIGTGIGGVTITSTGDIHVNDLQKNCRGTLGAVELAELVKLVIEAKGDGWTACYASARNPFGCCDQIEYSLVMKRYDSLNHQSIHYTTRWYDDDLERPPEDLRRLFEEVWGDRSEMLEDCH